MGRIKLSRAGVTVALVLEENFGLQRRAGRPNSEIRTLPTTDLPRYKDKQRPAYDGFSIAGTIIRDRTFDGTTMTPTEQARRVRKNLLRPPLGDGTLTLEFLNDDDTTGFLGLGTFTVAPVGGQAGRIAWLTGENGSVHVQNLDVREVS